MILSTPTFDRIRSLLPEYDHIQYQGAQNLGGVDVVWFTARNRINGQSCEGEMVAITERFVIHKRTPLTMAISPVNSGGDCAIVTLPAAGNPPCCKLAYWLNGD